MEVKNAEFLQLFRLGVMCKEFLLSSQFGPSDQVAEAGTWSFCWWLIVVWLKKLSLQLGVLLNLSSASILLLSFIL